MRLGFRLFVGNFMQIAMFPQTLVETVEHMKLSRIKSYRETFLTINGCFHSRFKRDWNSKVFFFVLLFQHRHIPKFFVSSSFIIFVSCWKQPRVNFRSVRTKICIHLSSSKWFLRIQETFNHGELRKEWEKRHFFFEAINLILWDCFQFLRIPVHLWTRVIQWIHRISETCLSILNFWCLRRVYQSIATVFRLCQVVLQIHLT